MREGPASPAPLTDPAPARLRLDLVTETWPPEINGVAMTLSRLVGGLRARGHDVTIVRPRQPMDRPSRPGSRARGAADEVRPGFPIPGYPELRWGVPSEGYLRRRWRRRRPHLVHVATEGPLGLSALRAARASRIPVTSTFHTNFDAYGDHYGYGWLARPIRRYLRWFHNRTRVTLVPSADLCDRLGADGFENCRLMGRGVDTSLFRPALRSEALRQAWGVPRDAPALLTVGRVAPEKNLGLAVRGIEAVRRRNPEARLVLVGDGPARASYEGLPGVVVRGRVSEADLAVHYASADLFVFPSLTETFGNVLCEAMASGLPAVAFDYAAAAMHVVHGESGWKAQPGDEEGFVRLVEQAAGDAAERRRLGEAARRRMLDVGWGAVVDRFEAEARTALAAGRESP